jgi:hypothetical protein
MMFAVLSMFGGGGILIESPRYLWLPAKHDLPVG